MRACTHNVEKCCVLERMAIYRLVCIPVKAPQPLTQPRVIVTDHFQVAHEDVDVRDVEADQSRVEADICLGELFSEKVRRVAGLPQVLLESVQGVEQRVEIGFIGFLRCRKARLIDAIVNRVIDPLVHLVDLLAQVHRVESSARF